VPRCPLHGLPCLKLKTKAGANQGRFFFKCANSQEAQASITRVACG
jgi:hypothetical protein